MSADAQYNNLGAVYFQQQLFDKADTNYLMATQLNPTYSDAYRNLVMIANNRKDVPGALRFLRHSVSLLPTHRDLYREFGDLLVTNGDYKVAPLAVSPSRRQEAEQVMRHALNLSPDSIHLKTFLLLSAFANDGTRDAAGLLSHPSTDCRDQYLHSLQGNEEAIRAVLTYARSLAKKKQSEPALAVLELLTLLHPNKNLAEDVAGLADLLSEGESDISKLGAARNVYLRALEIDDASVTVLHKLGDLEHKMGLTDLALERFNLAAKLNPNVHETV